MPRLCSNMECRFAAAGGRAQVSSTYCIFCDPDPERIAVACADGAKRRCLVASIQRIGDSAIRQQALDKIPMNFRQHFQLALTKHRFCNGLDGEPCRFSPQRGRMRLQTTEQDRCTFCAPDTLSRTCESPEGRAWLVSRMRAMTKRCRAILLDSRIPAGQRQALRSLLTQATQGHQQAPSYRRRPAAQVPRSELRERWGRALVRRQRASAEEALFPSRAARGAAEESSMEEDQLAKVPTEHRYLTMAVLHGYGADLQVVADELKVEGHSSKVAASILSMIQTSRLHKEPVRHAPQPDGRQAPAAYNQQQLRFRALLVGSRSRDHELLIAETIKSQHSASSMSEELTRTREGVPVWNGDAATFVSYAEAAELYEQTTAYHKRALVAPRLISELLGPAKLSLSGYEASAFAYPGGVAKLLDHLRASLGQPRIPELTDHLHKYFRHSRRKPGETINSYVAKKMEVYLRAQQAMKRLQPIHKPIATTKPQDWNYHRPGWWGDSYWRWSAWEPSAQSGWGDTSWNTTPPTRDGAAAEGDEPSEEGSTEADTGRRASWSSETTWRASTWSGSNYGGQWGWGYTAGYGSDDSWWKEPQPMPQLPELMPDFVQGWILLQDCNLDAGERNLVITATGGDFSTQKIIRELRAQFPDSEVKRRETARKHHSYLGENMGEEESQDSSHEDHGFIAEEEFTEEGMALWSEAGVEVESAMAAFQQARRTLREARAKQHNVKMSRQYYRGGQGPRSDANMICLNCGQKGHRASNCKNAPSNPPKRDKESAPFVCYAEEAEINKLPAPEAPMVGYAKASDEQAPTESALGTGVPTAVAVQQGKCVVDSGATRSIGSVKALEHLMRRNTVVSGDAGVEKVDTTDRPTFNFGNSSEDTCSSTVEMRLRAGELHGKLRVHALNVGEGPILLSVATLRALGAIIDFGSDLMCLRELDCQKLIQLERSATGHQDKIKEFGENPPTRWNKAELQLRLEELSGQNAFVSARKTREQTEYQRLVQGLTQACNRKAQLIEFCQNSLEMRVNANWTMNEMKREAMHRIYQRSVPEPTDAVGFGKWAALTYEEVKIHHPEYVRWVVQTATESADCDPRLLRLAGWLENNPARVEVAAQRAAAKAEESKTRLVPSPPASESKDRKSTTSKASSARSSASSSDSKIDMLAEMVGALREEIADLKKEPRRKKAAAEVGETDTEMSQESYTMIPNKTSPKPVAKRIADAQKEVYPEALAERVVGAMLQELNHQSVMAECQGESKFYNQQPWDSNSPMVNNKVLPDGREISGTVWPTRHRVVSFSGTQWHATEAWEGEVDSDKPESLPVEANSNQLPLRAYSAFRSQEVEAFCDRHGVHLDLIPADAHWSIGVCEQAVKGVKVLMSKIVESDHTVTSEEALSQAVRIFNEREQIRGYSPIQHAFGRSPDATGRLGEGPQELPDELLVESATADFERGLQRRAAAEKALADWQASQRWSRALNSRTRPVPDYEPGELVYFWRTQDGSKSRRSPGSKHGRFLGPARVLALERRTDETGVQRAGNAIWLIRGRNLLKCSPEQLRRASPREEILEGLASRNGDPETPWTYTRLADEIGGNRYEDLTQEVPDEREWVRAQDVEAEMVPQRFRVRGKRAEPEPMEEPPEPADLGTGQSSRPRRGQAAYTQHPSEQKGHAWWSEVADECWPQTSSYWRESHEAVEIEIPMPESKRGVQDVCNNLQAYFVGNLKRRAIEVSEKRLSEAEREEFRQAKGIEVKNFIAAEAFEALPEELKPSRDQAISMRWILTWKLKDDGTTKAKARAVLLGYQDPGYEHRATTAPVMTRQTRQLMLQAAANKGWKVYKGDVSGAFLQGRAYPDKLYCIPCKEICAAMGLPEGSITRVRRACYGLVDAPLEWYRTVSQFLESLGLERLWSDACAWVWRPNNQLRGMVSGHVDDFLFGGREDDREWQDIIRRIKEKFRWSDWESGCFTQCGVQIEQDAEGFTLSQERYVSAIKEIALSRERRQALDAPTTERERSQLRALLGALSWHGQQVAPHISAEVGLLLSEVNSSTVRTISKANQLLNFVRIRKNHKLRIHKFLETEELGVFGWVDAGSQNRPDGGSTQGLVIGLAPVSLLKGELGKVSIVSWSSHRIDRTCRSPGAAETQAAVNGEDTVFYVRYQWSEIIHGPADARDPEGCATKVVGCLISDSRNVYDKLATEVLSIKGAEKRSNLELLSLKEAQQRTGLQIRWVHSEAQLSNPLTKAGGPKELELFYRMGNVCKIVEDPDMLSAKRRKAKGLDPLQSQTEVKPQQPQQQQAELDLENECVSMFTGGSVVGAALHNLGVAYGLCGNAVAERDHLEKALEIQEREFGPDHCDVATTLSNLGNAYDRLGNINKQKELLERALAINEREYGPNHHVVATTLVNLGSVYGRLGEHETQRDILERALQIMEAEFGLNSHKVSASLVNLSLAYGALGDVKRQRDLLERALKINEQEYGRDHRAVANTLLNLGNVYGCLGDVKAKRDLLERALKIKQREFGAEHAEVAKALVSLGNAYGDLGNVDHQKELLEKALSIQERHFGSDHWELLSSLTGLSMVYDRMRDFHRKKELLEKSVSIMERSFGSTHYNVGVILAALAQTCGDLGEFQRKKDLLERSVQIMEIKFGQQHRNVAVYLVEIAHTCEKLGDMEGRDRLLRRASEIEEAERRQNAPKPTLKERVQNLWVKGRGLILGCPARSCPTRAAASRCSRRRSAPNFAQDAEDVNF
ncbi:nphp3 [Symbiodinium sp. CCMP2592]|nr:nphp3 [Symbiodinium sp. CCMP2592]